MQAQFSQITKCAAEAALKAGKLIRKGIHTSYSVVLKEGSQNYVTEYDTRAEKCIMDHIGELFPDHGYLGEESGHVEGAEGAIKWIIDALDGTTNFVHRVPLVAVSIAATYQKEILSAVIYLPLLEELFVAEKGKGAYLNGKPIHVSPCKNLEETIVVTSFPYTMRENPMGCIEAFSSCIRLGLPVRDLGSAAMSLAYVAAGRFDAYWMPGQHPWDMVAGKLLIEEAGGKVTDYHGKPVVDFIDSPILATNGLMHERFVALLQNKYEGRPP
jgi:myo-inositol-1(or 4)-monophosphatase